MSKHEEMLWERQFNSLAMGELHRAFLGDFPDDEIAEIYAMRDAGMTPAEAWDVVEEVSDVQ